MIKPCRFLKLALPTKLAELPDPDVDPFAWEDSWSAAPGAWRQLLKACGRRAAEDPWRTAAWLRAAGLALVSVDSLELPPADADELLCELCGRWWASKGALAQHRRRAHDDVELAAAARVVTLGPVCSAYGVNFHTRIRVCRHLKWGASSCQSAFRSGLLPTSPLEAVLAADLADRSLRQARRKAGFSAVAGPRVRRGHP